MVTSPASFDLCGPLPTGTHLLEASAGTGKTYAIAALTTRYIAEGRASIDQILLITFGRAATQELRERVRRRLVDTHRGLTRPPPADTHHGPETDEPDPVLTLLRAGTPQQVAQRCDRLDQAITGFDRATIVTTHAFCQQTLDQLGIAADCDPLESFEDDVSALTHDVVADLYVARFGGRDAQVPPPFSLQVAGDIAQAVIADPLASLAAGPVTPGSTAAERQGFAEAVRAEHLRRRRRSGITTYDDLVTRVDGALMDPRSGPATRQMLQQRFPVVMVDEFQDTDPLQWNILRRAFHGTCTLVLIADPKQAIYAFRGGDVATYLSAQAVADFTSTLSTNRRTDAALVERLTGLFEDIHLGDESITVRPVSAHHTRQRLVGGPDDSPWRVRTLPDAGTGKPPPVQSLREQVATDLTRDVIDLLTSDATLRIDGRARPVRPGDIAVLVDTNKEADLVHTRLRAGGVNAVVTASQNVFGSPAALHWLVILRALEKPQRAGLVRSAMITPFLGFTGTDLATGGDELLVSASQTIRSWSAAFRINGIAGVMAHMRPEMTGRVLARPDGERLMTDLRHVGEELHAAGATAGLASLIEWLTGRMADAGSESDESSRRLDTDSDAVQIVTVHRSKGLEYPITYVPFAWNRFVGEHDQLRLHDASGRRIVDIRGRTSPDWSQNVATHRAEDAAERLRLLYVAFTRASCQLITWWVRSNNTSASSLQRLIGARTQGTLEPAETYKTDDIGLAQAQQVLGGPIVMAGGGPETMPAPAARSSDTLRAAIYDRTVDTTWRRTSYSALTAAAHEAAHRGDDSPSGERDDEPPDPTHGADLQTGGDSDNLISPMAQLPVGATFGLVAHRIYELFDSSADDHRVELRRCAVDALSQRPLPDLTAEDLADQFLPSLQTSLGPLADDLTLATISPTDRLPELDFEFPLGGGDTPRGHVLLRDIAVLLRSHLPDTDPLHPYADRMDRDGLAGQQLTGFLSGSIDAVFRVGIPGAQRYLVADYKTNWVGGSIRDRVLTTLDYGPAAMAEAMMQAHYPLQALLYQVALHRFLRWRVPDYDPDHQLGGVLYLFVRGMSGPDTPRLGTTPTGVFEWQPSATLITALSDLLAGDP